MPVLEVSRFLAYRVLKILPFVRYVSIDEPLSRSNLATFIVYVTTLHACQKIQQQ